MSAVAAGTAVHVESVVDRVVALAQRAVPAT